MTLRFIRTFLLISLALGSLPTFAPAQSDAVLQEQVELRMNQAKKLGAKGQLPLAFWDLEARLKDARKNGATGRQWQRMHDDAQLLLNRIEYVNELREQKSAIEAMLDGFDRALDRIATLEGVERDRLLSGGPAATELIDRLAEMRTRRQVTIDSLTISNRRLQELAGGATAETDSLITALQVEVSALRQRLWETQLRADVAEADRSAAETVLTAKQEREAQLASLRATFGKDEAEILLTPEGGVILHLYGIAFAVGSAEIPAAQSALVDKVTEVVRIFPGGEVTVEGHTDNTGSRQANLRLSRRRAEAVARRLETELEYPQGLIATEGFGPDRPLALNDTAEGRARNRRIDVIVHPAE